MFLRFAKCLAITLWQLDYSRLAKITELFDTLRYVKRAARLERLRRGLKHQMQSEHRM